ncbi:MAG: hypothetical protein GC171_05870 [Terrimonas sp.]|nr:hypothetical protein [Terrimonas sp.]
MTLLIAFSLNTMIGFACSVGVDMGFNSDHHHDKAITTHAHPDSKMHHHEKKKHEHEKGNCCNDSVINILHTDKSVPHQFTLIHPEITFAFVAAINDIHFSHPLTKATNSKLFSRSHHPPLRDIRVSIRSFQI